MIFFFTFLFIIMLMTTKKEGKPHLNEIKMISVWGAADERDFRVGKVFFVVFAKTHDFGNEFGRLRSFSLSGDEVRETAGGKTEDVVDSACVCEGESWEEKG